MPTKREQFLPTIRAQFLGVRMREFRDQRGLTLKYVAGYLGVEFSTLARYERAEWPFRKEHVTSLLDVYGIYDDNDRNELVALATNAWRSDHWYRDGITPDAARGPVPDLGWIHQRATQICVYSPIVVPELARIEAYADEILASARHGKLSADERKKRLYDIAERARSVTRSSNPVRLHMVLEERVLSRQVGGQAVLTSQLDHLVKLGRNHANVDIQVMPDSGGAHPGVHGGFTVYRMPPPCPPVACVEHHGGTLLIEGAAAEEYDAIFNALANEAETQTDSRGLITLAKEPQ